VSTINTQIETVIGRFGRDPGQMFAALVSE